MKKTLCILFALLLIVSSFCVSCHSDPEEPSSESEESKTTSTADTSDEQSSDVPEKLVPHLNKEDVNLDGFTLKILALAPGQLYASTQFGGYEEDTEDKSDPVVDAVEERNNKIYQEYGVQIEVEAISDNDPYSEILRRVRTDFEVGSGDYQVVAGGANFLAPLTTEGICLDFYNLGNRSFLELDKEWWDPVTQEDMAIEGSLYMITGDISLMDDEMTKCIFFNKDIVEQNGLDSPFDLVRSKQWTMAKMYEMCKTVAVPGGDGVMNIEGDDTWGFIGVAFDTYTLVMGGGHAQIDKDENGTPHLAMGEEVNVNIFTQAFNIINDKSVACLQEDYARWDDNETAAKLNNQFYSGHCLFKAGNVGDVNSDKMRETEIRYGIVPLPMYSEEQENYSSTVNAYHFGIIELPAWLSGDDIKKTTFILEAMAYLAYENVTPQYYDRTLKLKRFVDDDDSSEMLDTIFRNRLVDMSVVFNWADCIQYYNRMFSQRSYAIASYIDSIEDSFNIEMQKTLDAFRYAKENSNK